MIPSPIPVEWENQGSGGVTVRDQHVSDGVGNELAYADTNGLQQEVVSVPRISRYTIRPSEEGAANVSSDDVDEDTLRALTDYLEKTRQFGETSPPEAKSHTPRARGSVTEGVFYEAPEALTVRSGVWTKLGFLLSCG